MSKPSQAVLFQVFAHFTIEEWGRLVSIIASVGTILFLYLLVKKYVSVQAGLLAGLCYAVIPFSIYYGRTILPDTAMAATIIGEVYFFDAWIMENKNISLLNKSFLLSVIFTMVALLLKPYALFFTLPMLYIAISKYGYHVVKKWQLWLFIFLAVVPLVLWTLWIRQYPEGIPVSDWLFNGGNIRFSGAYFYWLFADRITRLILGYWGLPLFILGVLTVGKMARVKHASGLFFSFLASSLLYFVVIARGNVQHDYYQILIIPSLTIFLSVGASFLLKVPKQYMSQTAGFIVLIVCILFMEGFGWYFVRDYFNINNSAIVTAGQAVNNTIPKNPKIKTPYNHIT